jgi:hypothetical protein
MSIMIVKLHKSIEGRTILAVCDSDLVGKCFNEKGLRLDLSSNFYKGEEMSDERILNFFKVVHIVNLAGEKAVALGIKAGIIDKKHVIKIKGIPHAQALIEME